MDLRQFVREIYRAIPFKRTIFGILRGRIRLPQRVYQHLHFTGPFRVEVIPGRTFETFSDGYQVENDLFWAGFGKGWEANSLSAWTALCRDRQAMILDIGANTGVYALAAAAVAPQAEVVAFEPIQRVADRLKRNIALNGFEIEVEQKAVSDRSGRLPIYDNMATHNYSASLEGQSPDAQCYEVEVVTIDDWLGRRNPADVAAIKIDVERHEPAVLRGMRRLVEEQRPAILIEILDESIGRQISEMIEGLGYRFFRIDEARGLIPTELLTRIAHRDRNHLLCTEDLFERCGLAELMADES